MKLIKIGTDLFPDMIGFIIARIFKSSDSVKLYSHFPWKMPIPLVFKFDFMYICKGIIIEILADGNYRQYKSTRQGTHLDMQLAALR